MLSLTSGVLLSAAWPVSPLTFLIFIALIPLFWMEAQGISSRKFFLWIFLSMLVWNAATTWWVINSTVPGGISAIVANSLLMCIPWLGFYNVKKRLGSLAGYLSIVLFWLTFEYIHLNWELSWPWLTLGNVFAVQTDWVQWYEYTGTSGGSLWVLLVNILLFSFIKRTIAERRLHVRTFSLSMLLIIFPLLLSYYVFKEVFRQRTPDNIVVVQPNVDPYSKFLESTEARQLLNLISLSDQMIDTNTKLVVWPETAIPLSINEELAGTHPFLQPLRDFLNKHPNIRLLTGIEGFRLFNANNKTKDSRPIENSEMFYDAYNTAALFDSARVQLYHKSKLVPGVETLPSFLNFLGKWFEDFGGTAGGYARQKERTVLIADNSRYKIAPSICYESIYGEFMAGFIRNGANIICVITNDGWWGDTPGYKQHKSYAKLRAIETRCWVVRSANTGISCFIDPYGNVIQEKKWDVATSFKQSVPINERHATFFVKNGDIISRVASGMAIGMLFWLIGLSIRNFIMRKKISK
ncbi:MAG TPA: apolipoprotein N-acyltransferase [Chitinophagaceae bacterium]|nr:apolipoprotein N-acyltransferase [Chitinophagaceae bacterium]